MTKRSEYTKKKTWIEYFFFYIVQPKLEKQIGVRTCKTASFIHRFGCGSITLINKDKTYNRGQNVLRKFRKHVYSTSMSVNNESKPSATPPSPIQCCSWLELFVQHWMGEEGAWNFTRTTDLREVVLFSILFSTLLSPIVADCGYGDIFAVKLRHCDCVVYHIFLFEEI